MINISQLASLGGKARTGSLNERQRKALASLGGLARARRLSARQRTAIARRAGLARAAKAAMAASPAFLPADSVKL